MDSSNKAIKERRRIDMLNSLEILDTSSEAQFDQLVKMASRVCGTPISAISLVDENRQWFKASVGLGTVRETPRAIAFCAHTIESEDPFVVEDAQLSPEFASNILVTGELGIRFYVGISLVVNGAAVGSLCAIDRIPRVLSQDQIATLQMIADQVVFLLQARETSLLLKRKMIELEAAERAASGKEEEFRALLSASFDGIIVHDGTKIQYANEAAAAIFFSDTNSMVGQDLFRRTGNEFLADVKARAQSNSNEHYRSTVTRSDGTVRQLQINSKRIIHRGCASRIVFFKDCTDLETLSTELEVTQKRLDALIRNMPGAVYRFTRNEAIPARFEFLSSGVSKIFGLTAAQIRGNPTLISDLLSTEDKDDLRAHLKHSYDTGEELNWSGCFSQAGGDKRWVQFIAQPILNIGEICSWDGIMLDITQETLVREQVEDQRLKLLSHSRMAALGEMAAGLAHEINNAINYISGSLPGLEKVLDKIEPIESRTRAERYFHAIREGTRVTTEIIRNLRSYTSSQEGVGEEASVLAAVETVVNILGSKLRERQVNIEIDCPPKCTILAKPGSLIQILMNLISNACDAVKPEGRIEFKVSESGGTINLRITDNGSGIEEQNLARLYDPFFTTKTLGKGTGLGLYVVYQEVKALGGEITCQSVREFGTTFEIIIPRNTGNVIKLAGVA